ncbi:putative 60S ribosomal protein L25 [Paratrimastix pyriformis]|uniref:60S ribosomal protein L25 n=1 Tax=Paratrimastix pyriformis TaxID=342808 RepID=A0ABQ8UET1_9EUKA|nr:putative 60S ribosomal protein L25 [Paratrimastix pyriformis]
MVKKEGTAVHARKVRTSVHFFRPKTLALTRNPKYRRHAINHANKMDSFQVIRHPLTTESAMQQVENHNTLVFIVDRRANKCQIRRAIQSLYSVKADRINTLIRPDGQKKAYVRLTGDYDTMQVAGKIGLI